MAYGFEQQELLSGLMDLDETMLYANRIALELVGGKAEDIQGVHFSDSPWRAHSEEARKAARVAVKKALSGQRTVVEDSFIDKDGVEVPILFSISPLKNEQGEIIGLIPQGMIISDLKRLQRRLETERWETRQWLDSLVSYVIRCSPTGDIIFCNRPLLTALGLELEEILGINFIHLNWPGNTPQTQTDLTRSFEAARAGKKSTIEVCYVQPGGEPNHVLISVSPIFDCNGKVVFLAAEAKNISDQVRAREFLLEQEKAISAHLEVEIEKATRAERESARLREQLIEAAPISVIFLDSADRVVFWNKEFATQLETAGINHQEHTGKTLEEMHIVPEESTTPFSDARYRGPEERALRRLVLHYGTDRQLVFEASTAPIVNHQGKAAGTVVLMNNVTKRERLEAELWQTRSQSEKLSALGQLVAGVAHEINNPLTSIIGCAEYLAEHEMVDADTREAAKLIAFEAKRSGLIVRNLLAFARQGGRVKNWANVNKIIRTVLSVHMSKLRDLNIEAELHLSDDVPDIALDITQMQQVFLNLISNAEDAIEKSGVGTRIEIRSRCIDGEVVVEVQDDGPGVVQENLPRIFDPFFTTKDVGEGTGLGLSICYGVIKEHGGTISSIAVKPHGARFMIRLPSPPAQKQAASLVDSQDTQVPESLLVIDDEPNICLNLTNHLTPLGCSVEAAKNGREALDRLRQRSYDFILLDLDMPVMGGLELFRCLVGELPDQAARTIFMTGTQDQELDGILRRGQHALLIKPFAREDVLKAFQEATRLLGVTLQTEGNGA